ncbi:hypothetical protein UCDDA912_g00328 [Diaporthe ampelina]|uniref:Uncharacterized protein n=1 Tax=Diaporthe ampelina TaxID=1214573 RepID=A0A0G2G0J0_9PEZI|nr:hypothetical protein UCDDA912_g00328 [Diaporthe ampelina]
MQFFSKTAISAAVLTALVQLSPAPIVITIPLALDVGLGTAASCVSAAASVAGTVAGAVKGKRDVGHPHQIRPALEGRQEMNKAAWESCKEQLGGANLNFSADSPGSDGIPSSCMTLLNVLTGDYNAGNPLPMGSDSALFRDLSNDDINNLQSALSA